MGNRLLHCYEAEKIVDVRMDKTKVYRGYCYEIVDGDTIKVLWKPGMFQPVRKDVIRLWKIDCPELKEGEVGEFAKKFTHNLCYKKYVKITPSGRAEKYGRWLALVSINGKDVTTLLRDANHVKSSKP